MGGNASCIVAALMLTGSAGARAAVRDPAAGGDWHVETHSCGWYTLQAELQRLAVRQLPAWRRLEASAAYQGLLQLRAQLAEAVQESQGERALERSTLSLWERMGRQLDWVYASAEFLAVAASAPYAQVQESAARAMALGCAPSSLL